MVPVNPTLEGRVIGRTAAADLAARLGLAPRREWSVYNLLYGDLQRAGADLVVTIEVSTGPFIEACLKASAALSLFGQSIMALTRRRRPLAVAHPPVKANRHRIHRRRK